jgi:polyisoprenoid-binding protein YceI
MPRSSHRRNSSAPLGELLISLVAGTICVAGMVATLGVGVTAAAQTTDNKSKPPGEVRFVGANRLVTAHGRFRRWELTKSEIKLADPKAPVIDLQVEVEIASIDTGNSQRDNHLRSSDFFDASKFPTASLRLYDAQPKGKRRANIQQYTGKLDFSMHGHDRTYDVTFDLVDGKLYEVRGKLTIDRAHFKIGEPYSSLALLSVYDEVNISYSAQVAK